MRSGTLIGAAFYRCKGQTDYRVGALQIPVFFILPDIKTGKHTAFPLHKLCDFMQRYYDKKVIILLDEYDTPMQEAYMGGYWKEFISFMRSLFNATFKTNPYLERAILTGITRVSKESIFSDLNNLEVVTTTSDKYADTFGFTQEEVSAALNEFDLSERLAETSLFVSLSAYSSLPVSTSMVCRSTFSPTATLSPPTAKAGSGAMT